LEKSLHRRAKELGYELVKPDGEVTSHYWRRVGNELSSTAGSENCNRKGNSVIAVHIDNGVVNITFENDRTVLGHAVMNSAQFRRRLTEDIVQANISQDPDTS
jgi:hypothetical protein